MEGRKEEIKSYCHTHPAILLELTILQDNHPFLSRCVCVCVHVCVCVCACVCVCVCVCVYVYMLNSLSDVLCLCHYNVSFVCMVTPHKLTLILTHTCCGV